MKLADKTSNNFFTRSKVVIATGLVAGAIGATLLSSGPLFADSATVNTSGRALKVMVTSSKTYPQDLKSSLKVFLNNLGVMITEIVNEKVMARASLSQKMDTW